MSVFVILALLLQCVLGDSTEMITRASNQFSNNLYQKLSHGTGNVLVCPISLHVALALVHQGAGGNTAAQLAGVLNLNNANNDIKEGYKSVLTNIKGNALKIATKLYPSASYELNRDYVNLAEQYFLSQVEGIDYSNPSAAAQKINKFVEEKTNNKIHDLISPDSISDLTKLIIVNAVHFQATWKKPFEVAYDDYFLISKQEKVMTKMMTQTEYFHYKEDTGLDAKILKMDYNEGDYSMLFILPNKDDGLPDVENKLANMNLESVMNGLTQQKVEVTIPKFTIEQTHDLKDTLIKMGAKDMFSSRADLRYIGSGDNLYVSDVIQKTFINVHENGTEAAAATAFLETLSAPSADDLVFYARIPFHFYLIKNNPSNILFHGRLMKPVVVQSHSEGPDIRFGEDSAEGDIRYENNNQEESKMPFINSKVITAENIVPTTNEKTNTETQNYNSNPLTQNTQGFQQTNLNRGSFNSFQGFKPNQPIQSQSQMPFLNNKVTTAENIVPNINNKPYNPTQNNEQFHRQGIQQMNLNGGYPNTFQEGGKPNQPIQPNRGQQVPNSYLTQQRPSQYQQTLYHNIPPYFQQFLDQQRIQSQLQYQNQNNNYYLQSTQPQYPY